MKLSELRDVNYTHFSSQDNKTIKGKTITVTTSYVTITKYKVLEEKPNGAYKVHVSVDRNYAPKRTYTLYYNELGREITRNEFKAI